MEMAPIQISSIRYTLLSQIRDNADYPFLPSAEAATFSRKYIPAVSYIDSLHTDRPRTAGTSLE